MRGRGVEKGHGAGRTDVTATGESADGSDTCTLIASSSMSSPALDESADFVRIDAADSAVGSVSDMSTSDSPIIHAVPALPNLPIRTAPALDDDDDVSLYPALTASHMPLRSRMRHWRRGSPPCQRCFPCGCEVVW